MIVTRTSIEIAASPATIYTLAAATERWPLILPHYRYVRVRSGDSVRRVVEMAAWRHCFPLRWIAEQTNDARGPHIAFEHVAGPTRGMRVDWIFAAGDSTTQVTIEHRLEFAFPVMAEFVGTSIVGGYFIEGVARKTLARMKILAEAGSTR